MEPLVSIALTKMHLSSWIDRRAWRAVPGTRNDWFSCRFWVHPYLLQRSKPHSAPYLARDDWCQGPLEQRVEVLGVSPSHRWWERSSVTNMSPCWVLKAVGLRTGLGSPPSAPVPPSIPHALDARLPTRNAVGIAPYRPETPTRAVPFRSNRRGQASEGSTCSCSGDRYPIPRPLDGRASDLPVPRMAPKPDGLVPAG